MERVSESFKNAIKSDTREIKGYVEVVYDDKDMSSYFLEDSPIQERISLDSEMTDMIRKCNKYASLEENYTELDGSFLLPNYNIIGDKSGYISKQLFKDIENPIIKVSCNNNDFVESSGITIYFQDNIAQVFDITIAKDDNTEEIINIFNNDKNIYQYVFEETIKIKSLKLEIKKMEYPNRRIRIAEIDFGISQIYEGQELISFSLNEEIDLLLTSTPINDCKVNLNNYSNTFDPINPRGIVRFLNDDTIIKPFIGVLTKENGVEYVKMGTFYLTNWSHNNDGNVTLNGSDIINQLKDKNLKMDINIFNTNFTAQTWNSFLERMYGYKFNIDTLGINNWNLKYTQDINLLNNLQWNLTTYYSFYSQQHYIGFLNASRDNIIELQRVNKTSVDVLNGNVLLSEPKYTINNLVTSIEINTCSDAGIVFASNNRTDVLDVQYILGEEKEMIWFQLSQYTFSEKPIANDVNGYRFSYSVLNGVGSAELIANNHYLIYVKITGTIGTKINIKYNGVVYHTSLPKYTNVYNSEYNIGEKMTIDGIRYTTSLSKSVADYLLNNNFKYKVNIETIGDPSLTVGDVISVQTKFGYKDIIMTKHSLTFDGGLSGNIEGMGD